MTKINLFIFCHFHFHSRASSNFVNLSVMSCNIMKNCFCLCRSPFHCYDKEFRSVRSCSQRMAGLRLSRFLSIRVWNDANRHHATVLSRSCVVLISWAPRFDDVWENGDYVPCILNLGTIRCEHSVSRSAPFNPVIIWIGSWVVSRGGLYTVVRKIMSLPGIDHRSSKL
jgi:hypothetical protein